MIRENVQQILAELPPGVELVAAAKTRSTEEILEAIEGGVKIIGQNYVQEAQQAFQIVGRRVKWHFIGHLQRNKAKKAVEIFDMIETVDSFELALELDKRSRARNSVISILIEINSGRESQKSGVLPENAEALVNRIGSLKNVKVRGLMTMGPLFGDPEQARPYFQVTRKIYEEIKSLDLPNAEMSCLSMGMTDSYKIALQEGANIVRIGTKIFGPR